MISIINTGESNYSTAKGKIKHELFTEQVLGKCPVCGCTTGLSSLKHHVKSCARKALANLCQCPICRRPIQKCDLNEHQRRCKQQGSQPCDNEIQMESLRNGFNKMERGELAVCDAQGMFACAVCGKKFTFGTIVGHQTMCERKLTTSSENPLGESQGDFGATASSSKIELNEEYCAELEALKEEIIQSPEINKTVGSSLQLDALKLSLGRLETICTNATGDKGKDKKYRKLKKSNPAFHAAIGRWTHGVGFMVKIGFQQLVHVSKNGEKEDVLQLPEPFTESALLAITEVIQAAYGTEEDTITCSTCKFCERKFRFDRIAKHETRCQSGKPAKKKFDYISHHLKNTPSQHYVSQIKKEGPVGKLPPIGGARNYDDGLTECPRCLRRFNPDSFFKHKNICKGDTRRTEYRDSTKQSSKTPSPEISLANGQLSPYPPTKTSKQRQEIPSQYYSAASMGAHDPANSGIRSTGGQRSRPTTPNRTTGGTRPMTPNRTADGGGKGTKRPTTPGRYDGRPTTPNRTGGNRPVTPNRTSARIEERPTSSRHMSSAASTSSAGRVDGGAAQSRTSGSSTLGGIPSEAYASSSSALAKPSNTGNYNNTNNYGSGRSMDSGPGITTGAAGTMERTSDAHVPLSAELTRPISSRYKKGNEIENACRMESPPPPPSAPEKITVPLKVVEAEKFVDYDQMDTVLDSWLDD